RGRREAPVEVAPRAGHRDAEAHGAQPARRGRRRRDARRAHVVRAVDGTEPRKRRVTGTPLDLGPALTFCPAARPERFEKALDRSDGVILDLEDAVSADAKAAARGAVIESELDPSRVIVRVNPLDSDAIVADLSSLSQTDYRTIMVAKAE